MYRVHNSFMRWINMAGATNEELDVRGFSIFHISSTRVLYAVLHNASDIVVVVFFYLNL